jgi:hypothetical protein
MPIPSNIGNHLGHREVPVREVMGYVRTLVYEALTEVSNLPLTGIRPPTGSDEPNCRRSSGAAFVTWASIARERFRFSHGQPEEFVREGWRRGFCTRCGTRLTFLLSAEADQIDVTVSSFDRAEAGWPIAHTWVEDRLPWIRLANGLPNHPQG